ERPKGVLRRAFFGLGVQGGVPLPCLGFEKKRSVYHRGRARQIKGRAKSTYSQARPEPIPSRDGFPCKAITRCVGTRTQGRPSKCSECDGGIVPGHQHLGCGRKRRECSAEESSPGRPECLAAGQDTERTAGAATAGASRPPPRCSGRCASSRPSCHARSRDRAS